MPVRPTACGHKLLHNLFQLIAGFRIVDGSDVVVDLESGLLYMRLLLQFMELLLFVYAEDIAIVSLCFKVSVNIVRAMK